MAMRILHVTPAYEPGWREGGIVRSLSELCRGMADLGARVAVYTTDVAGGLRLEVPIDTPVRVGGVEVRYFRVDVGDSGFRLSRGLWKACRADAANYDVIHLTGFWCFANIAGWCSARRSRKPYVVSTRGTIIPYSLQQKGWKKYPYWWLVEKRIVRGAEVVHATSELERRELQQLGLANQVAVIPNGVSSEAFNLIPDRADAKRGLGVSDSAFVITYLGRLHERKGLARLFEAVSDLKRIEGGREIRVLLAGPDAGFEPQLRGLSVKLGLTNMVSFLGFIEPDRRIEFLAAGDVFYFATDPGENFGNAAVEAMLCRVPVIASRNVGVADFIQRTEAGSVVSADRESVAAACRQYMKNSELVELHGSNARAAALIEFDRLSVAKRMLDLYASVAPPCGAGDETDSIDIPALST